MPDPLAKRSPKGGVAELALGRAQLEHKERQNDRKHRIREEQHPVDQTRVRPPRGAFMVGHFLPPRRLSPNSTAPLSKIPQRCTGLLEGSGAALRSEAKHKDLRGGNRCARRALSSYPNIDGASSTARFLSPYRSGRVWPT